MRIKLWTDEDIRKKLKKIKDKIYRFLYPDRCPVCDRALFDRLICPPCAKKIRYAEQPSCYSCGKPLTDDRQEYCADCAKKRHEFIQGKAVFRYQEPMRSMLYRYKYSNRRDYTEFFATEAARLYGGWAKQRGIGLVMPIPLSQKKSGGAAIIRRNCLRSGFQNLRIFRAARNCLCGRAIRRRKKSFLRKKEKII